MSAKTTRTLCFLAVMILAFGACTETVDSPPAPPTPSSWQGLPEVPTRPAAYVAALVDAWAHDDRGEMARYAPPSVVDSLTAVEDALPVTGDAGCFTHGGATSCEVITSDQRSLELAVDRSRVRRGAEQAVTRVRLLGGLPATEEEYVDALVAAWREGDRLRALRFATPEAVATLFDHGDARGWTRRALEAALGARFAFYENDRGELLVLRFNIASLSTMHGPSSQAVTSAEFPRPGDEGYNWD